MQYMEFASSAKGGGKEGKKKNVTQMLQRIILLPVLILRIKNTKTFAALQLMPCNIFCDTVTNKRTRQEAEDKLAQNLQE